MNIKEFAKETKTSPRTIRFYEEKGLLTPLRQENDYRTYRETDLQTMNLINLLKQVNFSLADINQILSLKNQPTSNYCKTETLRFLDYQIQQLEIQAKFNAIVLKTFQESRSIISQSSGENDLEPIIELLNKLAREV